MGSDVCHPRLAPNRNSPWRGRSILDRAPEAGKLLSRLEQTLADEMSSPVGHILPLPTDGNDNSIQELKNDIGKARGDLYFTETTRSGWGKGPYGAPTTDWQANRIGPQPPAVMPELLRLAQQTVLAAAGIPIEVVTSSDGTGQREAWRRCLHSTLEALWLG